MTTPRVAGARERVIDVATRLFAARGYDGTSTRVIAEAAGINIATLAYHAGGKRDLYLTVMERAHQAERAALEAAAAELRATGDVRLLADRYLDFCAANPQVPALWMRRWLSDAADVADLEARYVRPVFAMVAAAVTEVLGEERAAAVDVEALMWTVVWCVHGFGQGGMLDADGARRRAADPEALRRFRAHLRRLVGRQLGLSEDAAPASGAQENDARENDPSEKDDSEDGISQGGVPDERDAGTGDVSPDDARERRAAERGERSGERGVAERAVRNAVAENTVAGEAR